PSGGGSPVTSTGVVDTPIGDPKIVANNDNYNVPSGAAGGSLGSVLVNDTLGSTNGPTSGTGKGNVTLTWGATTPTPSSGGFTLNPDGTITVKPGTPAGTYKIPY
ncbi:hypothetical protein ACPV48_25615, partial [Vibrio harveyi]